MSHGAPTLLTEDRRKSARRAPKRPLDPLFAATLLSQLAPPESPALKTYPPKRGPRAGIAFDLKA